MNWTWLKMINKCPAAQIQLLGCYIPGNGTMWPDNNDVYVEVYNKPGTAVAYMTVKWLLNTPGKNFKNAVNLRLDGFWKVNGAYIGDEISFIYGIPKVPILLNDIKNSPTALKSDVIKSENNTVDVTTEANSMVVKATNPGENIKVYNTSGAEVKSFVINNDVVKIKLPENQIYIVNIGQRHYKVAL